jgi:hypothetical protein
VNLQEGPHLNPMPVNLREGPQRHDMDSPRHTVRLVCVPEPSAGLTMEASRWRTRSGGDRASEEDSMEEGPMEEGPMEAGGIAAAAAEGSSRLRIHEGHYKCIHGGKQSCTA